MTSLLIVVVGLFTALATGIASWLVSKRRNSGTIATSDAASLWTESATMRTLLREEVESLRKELRESSDKLDAAVVQIQSLLKQVQLSQQDTAAAREETRISREETAALRKEITAVHDAVKTGNSLTIGRLADNAESRRIAAIPPSKRTAGEKEHLDIIGIKQATHVKEGEDTK